MTISAVQQTILIPQSGLTFFAVQGGGPRSRSFQHPEYGSETNGLEREVVDIIGWIVVIGLSTSG